MGSDDNTRPVIASQRPFWLLMIFTVALMVRMLHLAEMNSAPFFGSKIGDAQSYDEWARRIAAGDWFGTEVFYQAPLYPYFLGSVYALLGDDIGTVLKIQALLGALSCGLLASAAWRLFSKEAGIATGFLMAFYAPAIFFESLLQKSALDLFLLASVVFLLSHLIERSSGRDWFWLGVVLGALVLTRENALIFVPLLLIWILLGKTTAEESPKTSGTTLRSRLRFAGCFLVGLNVLLLPVAMRNKIVGGELHLTTSQLGPNLFIGNNPEANGRYRPLVFGRGHARYERDDAHRLAESELGRSLSPAEVSAYYVDRVWQYVTTQPLDWTRLMSHKAALAVNAVELIDTEDQYTYAAWSLPLRITSFVGHFGVLVPLALMGCVWTWRDRRRLWLLYAMPAVYAASVVAFFVFGRYRYPLVPLLIPFAGAGLALLSEHLRTKSWRPLAAGAAIALIAAVACNLPLISIEQMQAVTQNNLANALARQGRFDEAEQFYRDALAIRPDYALAHNNLGVTLLHLGRPAEAAEHCQHALRLVPTYRNAQENFDRARAQITLRDETRRVPGD